MHLKRLVALVLALAVLALPAAAAPKLVTKTVKQSKAKIWKVAYDVLQIARPDAAQGRVNAALMKYAQRDIAAFVQLATKEHEAGRAPYDLEMGGHETYVSDRWLSVTVAGGEDLGGPHPAPLMASHLFDLRSGRELDLADLFKPGAPYLKVLSDRCRADLKGRGEEMLSDDKWLGEGSAPTRKNYRLFHLDGKHLVIVFPPYQVAPYAAGALEVEIPYADLRSIARPDGPLTTP